jgi:hypothetical protein
MAHVAIAGESIDLTPDVPPDTLSHVTVHLEVGGNNLVRPDAEKGATSADQKLPMSVSATLAYDERSITSFSETPADGVPLALRSYERAEATIKVDEAGRSPRLADDRKLIVVEQAIERPLLYCPDGPLSREQLDLIDVIGNTVAIDRLLPARPVAEGDSWANDASVIGPLLTFDSVAVCEVQSVLESFNANFAKIRLAGTVHGTEDGAAAQQEIRAVYLFDRRLKRVTRLNLAVREQRSIGGATPGLDAVAKLQITVDPIKSSDQLTDEAVGNATAAAKTPIRQLLFDAAKLGFRVQHDRQWYVTGEQREAVTLRRVDRGDLVAQCTLTMLPTKSVGNQTTLEQFQKDVTFALGKSFGELVSSRQWQNAAGHYCYEIVIRGLVEEMPVEWHYYLVAPESGHRISVAVTIEKPMVERLAGADRELIESLRLCPPTAAAETAAIPAATTSK